MGKIRAAKGTTSHKGAARSTTQEEPASVSGGRFSNLEFDDGDQQKPRGPTSAKPEAPRGHFVAETRDAAFYMRQAQGQELAGDHETALRSFSAALGEDPLLLEAWVGQARMLIELGEYPEARMWADKALEKFPDNPQLLAVKSVAMYRVGLCMDARRLNDVALQGKGESPLVWLCRADLMLADSRAAADQCFDHARHLASPKGPTLMRIGALYLEHGHYAEAMSALQEAASQLPKAARAWYLLGLAQQELALGAQAVVSFEQASSLAPRNAQYRKAADGRAPRSGGALRRFLRRLFGR